jgi:glycosyltransferase involved in cell wall biosynthesis
VNKIQLNNRIVYFVSEDWYFCSHRIPVARAAQKKGFDVWVVTRVTNHGEIIKSHGFNLVELDLDRSGLNVFYDLKIFFKLYKIFREIRPTVVHNVAIKPVIYGTIAAKLSNVNVIVNALAGFGFLFSTDTKGLLKFLQPLVTGVIGSIMRVSKSLVIVQNSADFDTLIKHMKIDENRLTLIRGSGVDLRRFSPQPEPTNDPIRITLVSRMLWTKGVGDLVSAGKILHERGINCVITLVGEPDNENSATISIEKLQEWAENSYIEWWGRCEDIPEVWRQSHIACLPSYYREGLPKSLLEAASCGRPMVSSDIPGCREIVHNNETGLIVPTKNPLALADALQKLCENPELRLKLGKNARWHAKSYFSEELVSRSTAALYLH